MGEGPVQQKALIGPEDTTRFTGGFDEEATKMESAAGNRRNRGRTFACAGGFGFSSGGQRAIEKRRRTGDPAVLSRAGAEGRVVSDFASGGAGDHVDDSRAVAAAAGGAS